MVHNLKRKMKGAGRRVKIFVGCKFFLSGSWLHRFCRSYHAIAKMGYENWHGGHLAHGYPLRNWYIVLACVGSRKIQASSLRSPNCRARRRGVRKRTHHRWREVSNSLVVAIHYSLRSVFPTPIISWGFNIKTVKFLVKLSGIECFNFYAQKLLWRKNIV